MHQIRFRPGLRHRPRWGSLQRSPEPQAGGEGWLPPPQEPHSRSRPFGNRFWLCSAKFLNFFNKALIGPAKILANTEDSSLGKLREIGSIQGQLSFPSLRGLFSRPKAHYGTRQPKIRRFP